MLRLLQKTPDQGAFYRQGQYSLVIAKKDLDTDTIILDTPVAEYVFYPNPTDADDGMQWANYIQPDAEGGFYVELNEIGAKAISIRGTTGQFPKRSIVERVDRRATEALTTLRGIPGLEQDNGQTLWAKLYNFFVKWTELIRNRPSGYAMLFLNTKDAEIFNVVPMSFRKIRTAARPLSYGYAIDLQIIGEQRPVFARSWVDWMNDIRGRVRAWQEAVNRLSMLASRIMMSTTLGAVGSVFGPITDTLNRTTEGVQSLVFTAQAMERYSIYSYERMLEVGEELFKADTYSAGANADTKAITDTHPPARSIPNFVPPTSEQVASIVGAPAQTVLDATVYLLSATEYGSGETTNLGLDDDNIETYADALHMMLQAYKAIDYAPLPSSAPSGDAGSESRDMHRAARAGEAGLVTGRSDEFASAALAGETAMLQDSVLSTETRHSFRARSVKSYTLSHIAAIVVRQWASAHNDRLSPQLNAFRKWFLNMGDPSAFAPLYKNVEVKLTDTIYSLAQKHLNSWMRWPEIALVNGLKYPYISPQTGPYQKGPGDVIYIPIEDAKIPVSVVENLTQIQETHDRVGLQDLFLGFDVEINPTSHDTVYSVFDVGHVAGIKAFQQEMDIVIMGSGGITSDKSYGPPVRIGSKSRGSSTLDWWRGLIKQWFMQDRRVNTVNWVQVEQTGDAVYYTVSLVFENFDDAVTLAGELRN